MLSNYPAPDEYQLCKMKKKPKNIKMRNPEAQKLSNPRFKQRIVKNRKKRERNKDKDLTKDILEDAE